MNSFKGIFEKIRTYDRILIFLLFIGVLLRFYGLGRTLGTTGASFSACSDRARSLKQFFFSFAPMFQCICLQATNAALSSAKTGDTVMSVNPNKHKMNEQDVIINLCNIKPSVSNDECSYLKSSRMVKYDLDILHFANEELIYFGA